MALLPNHPQIDRLALCAAQKIANARDVARDNLGEATRQNDRAMLQIAAKMMTREAAELIGVENVAGKKGR